VILLEIGNGGIVWDMATKFRFGFLDFFIEM
jgi:hypothetical protein